MLIFYEEWNRREVWKKSACKMVNSAISGQIWKPVLIPLWSGTSTADPVAKRYRYRSKSVPVQPSRTESVPIPIRAVPVPMAPAAPVFVIFAYLS